MSKEKYTHSIELLIEQLAHENRNCNLYLSISSMYLANGLSQLSHYFHMRAMEERKHSDWIINYLRNRNVCFIYPQVPKGDHSPDSVNKLLNALTYSPKTDKEKCLLTPFVQTVVTERETTKLINAIYDAAREDNDRFLMTWLEQQGGGADPASITDTRDGQLIREQDEEESISMTILNLACQESDWLTKEISILHYYNNR